MAYTAEGVDDLVSKFEKCAERQVANKHSAVKLRAAERDLLQVAEASRNLMLKAVKGDKSLLSQVFGGSCSRFHRFRNVLETVDLSEMHASDQRWKDLSEAILTIEEVLKQLGMFKPWQIGTRPPEGLSYRGVRPRFAPGERVALFPDVVGDVASFSVEPALPEGLSINTSTGEISGTLRPGLERQQEVYTVTARNDAGAAMADLSFAVAPPPPEGLCYSLPAECFTGEQVAWPAELAGAAKAWSVEPPLPRGLQLDESGAITGCPAEPAEAQDYCVTASNASGQTSSSVRFEVKVAPPVSLAYPGVQLVYPVGVVLHLTPDVMLKTAGSLKKPSPWQRAAARIMKRPAALPLMPNLTFAVQPALPVGLVLATKTGVISGKCDLPVEEAVYTVTVCNAGGQALVRVPLSVKLNPPSALSYPEATSKYFTGVPVALSPQVEGLVTEWTVTPELPHGLHLDAAMGIISGIPSEIVHEKSWTVLACNPEGATSMVLRFAVQRVAPSGLSYPASAPEYPVDRLVVLHPAVDGEVDSYSVFPALPDGLTLDLKMGVVQGTPKCVADPADYTITAKNESGQSEVVLAFGVKLMPPHSLSYPQVDDVYSVGEEVHLVPLVEGGATTWAVEPPLPTGLSLDASGLIIGAPGTPTEELSYVVTASNEAGGTSVVLTFGVTAPRPEGLSYPAAGDYLVGREVLLEPELRSGVCTTFSIAPALPPGLALDAKTGVIQGTPSAPVGSQTYKVMATNVVGTAATELTFAVSEPPSEAGEETGVNQDFALMIEEITDLADMVGEPSKSSTLGDWMIWMVHRAWLNDPTLTDFNFNNLLMPLPHLEPRIAPKLMKAMARNTHIVSLQLAHSNLQKPQGHELAEALKKNTALQVLNVETNSLDSDAIRAMAEALKENESSGLEIWRFNNQKHLGAYFGRPVEQAIAEMIEKNVRITKLGFACNDPNWRLQVDRAILRNTDFFRRKRKGSVYVIPEAIAAQEKTMSKLELVASPEKAVWEVFDDDNVQMMLVRGFIASKRRLPTKEQLQSFAREQGKQLPYSAVAPLVKEFRSKMLDSVVNLQVLVTDTYGVSTSGCMRAWMEKNDRWSLDVWPTGDMRFNFSADKQPIIEASEEFAAWLRPSET